LNRATFVCEGASERFFFHREICLQDRVDSSNAESKRLNSPGRADDWGSDRSLRAEVVTWLCEISQSWNPVAIGVIEIRGAKIEGELRLDNASINVVLRLLRCCIKGTIYLRNATLRTIDLEGTYLFPTKVTDDDSKKRIWCIKATEAEINGSVRLKNGFSAFGMADFDNQKSDSMTNNPTTTIRLGILGTGKKDLRSGIIGLGNMGSLHARSVLEGKVPRMRLTAVCDINPERFAEGDV
jgi:hypothetical protein